MTLAQCLDECLETRKIVCRSVMHSERYNTCLLSEYDTINGKLEYNPHYNYFENLMGEMLFVMGMSGGMKDYCP